MFTIRRLVPHIVPISWRQIKNRIPLDFARIQATNESCRVESEHCWVLQCGARYGQVLGRQQAVVQHMRALPHGAVADALATLRASQASVTTKRAFEFLVLTAARSGEVRLATWDEMDLDAGVWTIPAARMKAKRDHRVPLSGRVLAILHDVQRLNDGTRLVFRSLAREATLQHDAIEIDQGTRPRRRAAWVPVELPGLGRGTDEHTPRSGRGRTRPFGTKPHRGGLRAQ